MDYSVIISEAAESDIRDAWLWYEQKQENLGSRFESNISGAISTILKNPFKTQIRYSDIRVFFLKKFPFGIHYKVSGKNIIIIAIFHTSMNPQKWKKQK